MQKKSIQLALPTLFTLLLIPIAALAQSPNDAPPQRPVQAAIDACQNKNIGDSVEFTNRRGDTVTATCTLVAIPNQPQYQGKMDAKQHGKRGKMGKNKMRQGEFGTRLALLLGLTPEQQAQLKQIRTSHLEENAPQREKIQAQRLELHQAMMAQPFDEAKLRSIIQKQSQERADMMVENARFREQLFRILTPEQQQKWEQHQLQRQMNRPHRNPQGMNN
ncbi:MAG: Spy/CpxP family protein refolding chaperone [Desulfuromonas sp.]|nr:Spy/CpxP family protein refolding chaperone [Desulfuromonas sp.]